MYAMHILLVDDHQLLCTALAEHLERIATQISALPLNITPVFTFDAAMSVLRAEQQPDMVFLDLDLGDGNQGLETLRRFQDNNADNIPIVVFTGLSAKADSTIELLRSCLRDFSARGILLKSTNIDQMFTGIARLFAGERWMPDDVFMKLASSAPQPTAKYHLGLSPSEWRVANFLVRGYPDKRIAIELSRSPGYIRQVTSQIYKKLDVGNRTAATKRLLTDSDARVAIL
jgi:two-component system, NarL family, nitrate/nitrite response regulator NarL